MEQVNERATLSNISEIKFGLYDQPADSGTIQYLLARHFDENGILQTPDAFLENSAKTQSHLLQDGDVLYVGKGNRLFSWCYRSSMGPMVASSIFFILRPNQRVVYPEFLAALLNLPETKESFLQIGKGTNIFSIRKSELGVFEISLPPLKEQMIIADVAGLHQKEIYLLNQIINQKKQLYKSVVGKSLNNTLK